MTVYFESNFTEIKSIPMGQINCQHLVLIMVWHLLSALPEPMMAQFIDAYMRDWVAMSFINV